MNKPKLSDYNISNSQYLKYEEYRIKCKARKNKIGEIIAILGGLYALLFLASLIFLFVFFFFTKVLDRYPSLSLFALVSAIIIIILAFHGERISGIIKAMCEKMCSQPPREPYFSNIEAFEGKSKEYEANLLLLEERYPGIASFNYDKNRYFKNIFDKIFEYEKTYISDIIKKLV